MPSSIFGALQASGVAQAVAKSNHLVGAGLQIVHVLGLLLLLASVLLISLRAFELVLRRQSLAEVGAQSARLLWVGMALASLSGGLIFLSSAVRYAGNSAFDLKVAFLVAAIILQIITHRSVIVATPPRPLAVKSTAALSLLLWFGVAVAGRAIGYI